MYFRVAVSSCERCSLAGKYEAKSDQIGKERKRFERRLRVPSWPAGEKSTYMTYGKSIGHVRGMAQRKKKRVRKEAMESV